MKCAWNGAVQMKVRLLKLYGISVSVEAYMCTALTSTIFMFKYCKVVQRVFICFGLIFFLKIVEPQRTMGVCLINMQLARNSSIHTLSINLPIILYEFVCFLVRIKVSLLSVFLFDDWWRLLWWLLGSWKKTKARSYVHSDVTGSTASKRGCTTNWTTGSAASKRGCTTPWTKQFLLTRDSE